MMLGLTPLVEPLSIDEAFMDLSCTESLHGASPATTLAALARRVEEELAITVSIGLSYNKFLAKIASDLDKPRGFAVNGRAEAEAFLSDKNRPQRWQRKTLAGRPCPKGCVPRRVIGVCGTTGRRCPRVKG